jgi:hypothetical protein
MASGFGGASGRYFSRLPENNPFPSTTSTFAFVSDPLMAETKPSFFPLTETPTPNPPTGKIDASSLSTLRAWDSHKQSAICHPNDPPSISRVYVATRTVNPENGFTASDMSAHPALSTDRGAISPSSVRFFALNSSACFSRACPHLSQARAQTKCRPARKLRAVFS